MRNNGKVYSKRYQDTVYRASVSARRATDEERTWTGVTAEDGKRQDPDMFRAVVQPVGGRYETAVMVDQREASPYRKDGSVKQK
ncbi:MAG: hypothetical protein A4E30_00320 [Methanomassiliicoccales archaeon PtaB.Bin215]|nr:MAG: hypothetical protein A4E30_00320 [Methanomassiliicoccales archaeon PtaB.Bin215]